MITAAILSVAAVLIAAAMSPNIIRVVCAVLIAHADALDGYRETFAVSHHSAARHLGLERE